jgi:hypothetical protein
VNAAVARAIKDDIDIYNALLEEESDGEEEEEIQLPEGYDPRSHVEEA